MNKYLSDKIKAISFILMGLVVFLHAYNLKVNFSSGTGVIDQGINSFIQDFISQGLGRIAVPLFFTISGYLFFFNIKKGSFDEFVSKYKKRAKTLLLPYFLWSIFGLLLYLGLQSFPISASFFTNDLIVHQSPLQLLSKLTINPIPYQFWFIRDLILLIIVSPILYRLIVDYKFIPVIIFFVAWVFNFSLVIFSIESLLFFALGAYLSIEKIKLQNTDISRKQIIGIVTTWLIIVLIKTILMQLYPDLGRLIYLLKKSSIIVGIVALWLVYDLWAENKDISKTKVYHVFKYSFFLFAFHEPILTIFTKGFYHLLGLSEMSSLITYFLAPLITIIISILVASSLRRLVPRFYYLVTGGR